MKVFEMMIAVISGAKSRALALFYLTCVLFSLTPSVVCPPERNFSQGQPELQQAMDNMIIHQAIVKKSGNYPSSDDTKASSMFNNRATVLLDEAENMLTLAKDMREKAWLEHFVHKLKMLASILEQNIANHTRDNESYTFATIETAHTLANSSTPGGDLPQVNSLNSKSETVPETGPGQVKSNQVTSKLPLTLPDKNQVKSEAYHANTDRVTKSGIIPPLTEKVRDELVEELESLHRLSSLEPFDRSITAPETSSISVELSTQTSLTAGRNDEKQKNEQEKEKLKERIANEVAELKKLGETEENILNAIHIDGFKSADPEPLKNKVGQSPGEHATVKRVLDENNPHYWNLPEKHIPELPRQIYLNNTFLGMHINLPPISPRVLRRQFRYGYPRNSAMNNFPLYHDGLKGTIQNLQTQTKQNFLQRNYVYGDPNFHQQGNPVKAQRAGGMNSYGASGRAEIRSRKQGNPVLNPYVSPDLRPLYMPYPLNQNVEQRSTTNATSTTFSLSKDPTEFTEEMKRQLRDGKVILLSDSVVSSNYTSNKEKDEEQKVHEPTTEKK